MSSNLQIRASLGLSTPGQADSSVSTSAAKTSNPPLYDPGTIGKAPGTVSGSPISPGYIILNKDYVLKELDSADKYAQLAFQCEQEGDTAKAQQYMQYATEIRKDVERVLTCPEKNKLEDIIRLQTDALQKMGSGSFIDTIQAYFERAQAGAESVSLRNDIASGPPIPPPFPPIFWPLNASK